MVNASPFYRKTETKTVMTYLKRPVYFHPGNEQAMRSLASLQPGNGHDLQGRASLLPCSWHALKSLSSLQPCSWHALKSLSSLQPGDGHLRIFHLFIHAVILSLFIQAVKSLCKVFHISDQAKSSFHRKLPLLSTGIIFTNIITIIFRTICTNFTWIL